VTKSLRPFASAKLQATATRNQVAFFEAKAQAYAASPWSDLKLTERLTENFRVALSTDGIKQNDFSVSGDENPKKREPILYDARLHQTLRLSIESGLSLNEIFGSKKLFDLMQIERATSLISAAIEQNEFLTNGFRKRASQMGFDIKTADGIEKALAAYDSNTNSFYEPNRKFSQLEAIEALREAYPDGRPGCGRVHLTNRLIEKPGSSTG
jgi:hypothetical protein